MAEFQVDFDDSFLKDLLETDFDEICEEALTSAAPIFEEKMKSEVQKTILHEGESELVESFRASKPVKTKNGAWLLRISPKGYSSTKVYTAADSRGRKTHRKYRVSNALKAIWKEYGIPGRQPPRPFIESAANNAKTAVMEKIQQVYNRRTGAE